MPYENEPSPFIQQALCIIDTAKEKILLGVRDDHGDVHVCEGVSGALRAAWSGAYSAVVEPSKHEERVLEEFVTPFDFSSAKMPSVRSYSAFLCKAADSAPGPDGIPYAAWRAAGADGATTLYNYGRHLANGGVPHAEFNTSLMEFPPKGEEPEDDANGVVRHVMAVRPLSLKNLDNKTVAGVFNQPATPVFAQCAHPIQNRFHLWQAASEEHHEFRHICTSCYLP